MICYQYIQVQSDGVSQVQPPILAFDSSSGNKNLPCQSRSIDLRNFLRSKTSSQSWNGYPRLRLFALSQRRIFEAKSGSRFFAYLGLV